MFPRLRQHTVHSHVCSGEVKGPPADALVAGVAELRGRGRMVVPGCHQEPSVVHHSDPPAPLQRQGPGHAPIT